MNIAIINNLYEPFARGGAERIAKLQFEGLRNRGHNVITISLKPYGAFVKESSKHYYISSAFSGLNKIPKFLRLFWHFWDVINFVNYFKIKRILRAENIDTVITHNMTGIGKLSLLNISKKYKHIHVLHDIALLHPSGLMFYKHESMIDSAFATIYQKINKLYFLSTDVIVSPSKWLLNLHVEKNFFSEKIKTEVIMNPVENFPHFSSSKSINGNEISDFLYVGLISKHKGLDLLLDAWGALDSVGKMKLTLVGECADKDLLERINNSDFVEYIGPKPHAKILNIMQTADCLIMPSICYENSPTVIYEAASLGLPVIASSLGGASELVGMLGGRLFEPGKEELGRQIESAIKNPTTLRDDMNDSRRRVLKYSVANYAERVINIIEDID